MGTIASQTQSTFVISTGDNFYDNGVTSEDDIRFKATWEDVYSSIQVPWYFVAGNRDYYGDVQALVKYSAKNSRWVFPSLSHDIVMNIPNSADTAHFIFLDSWDLTSESKSNGGPAIDPVKAQQDLTWVRQKLESSSSKYKILVVHYPIYSAGSHGPVNKDLQAKLEPILLTNKPDLVLSGHDHSEQHLYVNGTNYFVVGGGSEVTPNWDGESGLPTGSLYFKYPATKSQNHGGFAHISIHPTNGITVNMYNDNAVLRYSTNLIRGASPPGASPTDQTTGTPSSPTPPSSSNPAPIISGGSTNGVAGMSIPAFAVLIAIFSLTLIIGVVLVVYFIANHKIKWEEYEAEEDAN
eukprot:TRINITY_DN6772_c0_g1_i1.p1 TRINITY_DN6772_c0_g1~~TRINITY_DN6772_c0_g1_i1.p1  ORF type:complete len:401 (-),score=74.73 TRINITY_DN6772_c0_g1_i1:77-1132(-)